MHAGDKVELIPQNLQRLAEYNKGLAQAELSLYADILQAGPSF